MSSEDIWCGIALVLIVVLVVLVVYLVVFTDPPKQLPWVTVHSGALEDVEFQPTTTNRSVPKRGMYTIRFKDGYALQGLIRLDKSAWVLGEEYDLQSHNCNNIHYRLVKKGAK